MDCRRIFAVFAVVLMAGLAFTCLADNSSASSVSVSITESNYQSNASYTMNVGETLNITQSVNSRANSMHYGIIVFSGNSPPSIPGITFNRVAGNTVGSGVYEASGTLANGAGGNTYSIQIGHLHEKNNDSNTKVHATITITVNAPSYTVSYNSQGGSSCSSSTGVSVTLPSTSRTNYSFDGWYTAASGGSFVGNAGASYRPSSNTTLYAHWTINKNTVTFNSNGGSSVSSSNVNAGSSMTLPTSTLTGYNLDGWYTAASGGTKVGNAGDSYTPTSNVTLYAHWSKITYTVTFNSNGGNTVSPSTVEYGKSLNLPNATRSGYQFNGWYTASSGGTKVGNTGDSYTPASSKTLYAQWTRVVTISSSAPTGAVVGNAYAYAPVANVSGCTVTISNAPSWLSVSNGIVVGTPVAKGAFSYTVTLSSPGCLSASQTVSGTVYSSLTFNNPSNYSIAFVVSGQ